MVNGGGYLLLEGCMLACDFVSIRIKLARDSVACRRSHMSLACDFTAINQDGAKNTGISQKMPEKHENQAFSAKKG